VLCHRVLPTAEWMAAKLRPRVILLHPDSSAAARTAKARGRPVTVDEGIAPPASAAKPCVRVSTSHGSSNVQCLSDRPSALVRRLRHGAVPL
jgi:hypothetical protein